MSSVPDVDALFALLASVPSLENATAREGSARESVSGLDHGLQCAHELALAAPDDEELQVAGLVHDIGHVLVPGDDGDHGRHAATAVLDLLGLRVARLVEAHVPAKRYLVAASAGYERKLSAVSEDTLGRQGGPMSVAEATAFRATPDFADALVLRHADDAAKVHGRLVLGLDYWRPLVERVARRAAAGAGQKIPLRTGPVS